MSWNEWSKAHATWGTSLREGTLKETCGKGITLCSTIRPIGYDFESGGHLVRACLCSVDIVQDPVSIIRVEMLVDALQVDITVKTLIKRPLLDRARPREARP